MSEGQSRAGLAFQRSVPQPHVVSSGRSRLQHHHLCSALPSTLPETSQLLSNRSESHTEAEMQTSNAILPSQLLPRRKRFQAKQCCGGLFSVNTLLSPVAEAVLSTAGGGRRPCNQPLGLPTGEAKAASVSSLDITATCSPSLSACLTPTSSCLPQRTLLPGSAGTADAQLSAAGLRGSLLWLL